MFLKSKNNQPEAVLEPIETVHKLMEERKLRYQYYEDNNIFSLSLNGNNVSWNCVIHVDLGRQLITLRCYSPVMVQDAQKLKMAELIARLNLQFTLGQYVINFEEGDIYFETVHLFHDNYLPLKTLDTLFYVACKTFDDYFNAINKVNMGDAEPVMAALSMQ